MYLMVFLIKNQFNLQNSNMMIIKIKEIIQMVTKIKKVFLYKFISYL